MEFGWVIQVAARPGMTANELMEHNRAFLRLLSGKFKSAWVEDHFQWEARPTLECWTTLAFLAGQYEAYTWGSLVLGQSYRNPALTAKMGAVLHALTGGRLVFGLGAGWKEDEYQAYGYEYPPPRVRIAQLAEALEITRRMWTTSPATFHGRYYRIENAYCEPRPQPPPPIMVGGSGNQTLRVAARYADWWNGSFIPPAKMADRLRVLEQHCAALGRPYDSIRKTWFGLVSLADDPSRLVRRTDLHVTAGDADGVTRELEELRDLGCDLAILRFADFPEQRGAEEFLEKVLPRFE